MIGETAGSTGTPLQGAVAIVTGGGSGIGQATCLRLAREGARIVVVDLDPERAERTAKQLDAAGASDHLALALSVRREEDMEEMARRTLDRFGRIDILAHCAGILHPRGSRPRILAELSAAEFDDVVETNLKGTFLANRAVLRPMMRQRGGQIINISSTLGRKGEAMESAYCASKFGVIGLSEALADEGRPYGIKVQVICPGAVDTPLWEQNSPLPGPETSLPPERVADLIAYLLALPADTMLQNVVLVPFKTRRRKKAPPAEGAGGGKGEAP